MYYCECSSSVWFRLSFVTLEQCILNKVHKSQIQPLYAVDFPRTTLNNEMKKKKQQQQNVFCNTNGKAARNRYKFRFFGLWCGTWMYNSRTLTGKFSSAYRIVWWRTSLLFQINFVSNRLSELDWNDCVSAFAFPSSSQCGRIQTKVPNEKFEYIYFFSVVLFSSFAWMCRQKRE